MNDLPELILFEDHDGDWACYIEVVYNVFKEDFVIKKPVFNEDKTKVRINSRKIEQKEFTFWHIVSTGKVEEDREPDLRRCERIRFPRYLIESSNGNSWKKEVQKKNGGREERIHIATNDFSYMIVLSSIKKGQRTLITAFYVEREYQRKKYEKDFKRFKK